MTKWVWARHDDGAYGCTSAGLHLAMTLLMGAGLVALAVALAAIGGAVGGITLGGKDLGKELAAMMGAFYGPTAVLPAAVVGLIILMWLL